MIRLNLISGPRNISTALMYSFAQRQDTRVLDEPFYACYLAATNADHPGKDAVLASQPAEPAKVFQAIYGDWPEPVLFIKNMAHHIEQVGEDFSDDLVNIFLIRDPGQIITSYAQVVHTPVMRDIGIEYQFNLFKHLQEKGHSPIVIDSGVILDHPEPVLRKLCTACGIPFTTEMLHWPVGPKPYDGVWAKYWYGNVHQSSGFKKQRDEERTIPGRLMPLYKKSLYYYQKLQPFSLKA